MHENRFGKWSGRVGAGLLIAASICLSSGCDHQGGNNTYSELGKVTRTYGAGGGEVLDVRVLLLKTGQVRLTCSGSGYGLFVDGEDNAWLAMAKDQQCLLSRSDGQWQVTDSRGVELPVSQVGRGDTIIIVAEQSQTLRVGREELSGYRGRLQCVAQGDDDFAVVNVVDLEDYLSGVVPAEMYAYWPMAALRAQSIASRTYAMQRITAGQGLKPWDIEGNVYSQAYGGAQQESDRVTRAVRDTRGIVLTYKWRGRDTVFPTYYCSVCGGHTQDAAEIFGESLAPLRGRGCPYCRVTAPPELYRWGPITIAKRTLSDRLIARYPVLTQLESIVGIELVRASDHGRAELFELLGSNAKRRRIRAVELRLAVTTDKTPISSSWYRLRDDGDQWVFDEGRGFGHGVGLCQYGSEQMARLGKDCVQILQHYYPQASLARLY